MIKCTRPIRTSKSTATLTLTASTTLTKNTYHKCKRQTLNKREQEIFAAVHKIHTAHEKYLISINSYTTIVKKFIRLWSLISMIGFFIFIADSLNLTMANELQTPTILSASPATTINDSEGFENNTSSYMEQASIDSIEDATNPSEVQKAVCTVTAGEVRASAEAVTTKTLKGVCGSAELQLAFRNLENKLYRELQEIKLLLQQLTPLQNGRPTQAPSFHNEMFASTTTSTTSTISPSLVFQTIPPNPQIATTTTTTKPNTLLDGQLSFKTFAPQLKSLPSSAAHRQQPPQREEEVSKFNNTLLSDRDFKVFTYYWKLENFTQHITNAKSATIDSPIFSIKGKALQIKAFFHYMRRDFLYIQLTYATLKQSNRHNIILDMGGLFKEIANDKVIFKHKISILDQYNQRGNDLVSQEFINFETGFLVPNSALLTSHYVKQNGLLIQIFLYL